MHPRTYTSPDANSTIVRKRLNEVAVSLDNLRQAALHAQTAWTKHDTEIAAIYKRLAGEITTLLNAENDGNFIKTAYAADDAAVEAERTAADRAHREWINLNDRND